MEIFTLIANDLFFAAVGFTAGLVLSDHFKTRTFSLRIRRRK